MRYFLLFTFLSVSCFGLTVSSVGFTNISHGSLQVTFNADSAIANGRIRYAASPATCTAGSGGTVVYPGIRTNRTTPYMVALSGLAASTSYQICPEITADGNTWTTGVGAVVTTSALPGVHPAPPLAPATFNYSYPNTTGYTQVTVAADCHDLMADINTAISNQLAKGTVINIPPGTVCMGTGNGTNGNYWLDQVVPPDVKTFAASAVSGNTINLPSHGFGDQQAIIFSGNYSCISPNCAGNGNTVPGQIVDGQIYYVKLVDANNFQVSATPGGSAMTLNASGNNIYVVKWPRPLNWIVIRTATPDAQFAPAGTRVNPSWAPKMAVIQSPLSNLGDLYSPHTLFSFSDTDGNDQIPTANIYLMGIEFTYQADPYFATSSDPIPWWYLYNTSPVNENIICDRCYFHGTAAPGNGGRVERVIGWDGMNVAFTNSYLDGMHYFHGSSNGLGVTTTSATSFTIDPGNAAFGAGKGSLAGTATINFNGTENGGHAGYTYFDFSGQLNIVLPPGLYPGTSGSSLIQACGGSNTNCVIKAASNTGGGRYAGGASAYPSGASADEYFVEPIYSSTSSCSSTQTITGNAPVLPTSIRTDGPWELGEAFQSTQAGYICGIRFYSVDSEPGRTVSLWDSNGTRLATAGSPENVAANSWQTVMFSSPYGPISTNATYVASFHTTDLAAGQNFFQNGGNDNAPLHIVPFYVDSNTFACNYSEQWPLDAQGRPAAGGVSCLALVNGSMTGSKPADLQTSQFATEGCQCMIGGNGPGPYAMVNNHVEGSGNMWHHDDGHGAIRTPGDYTYYRNYFTNPLWTMRGSSTSDGNIYLTRQTNEWKGGKRIQIYGSIYDTSYNSVSPASLTIAFASGSSSDQEGITDVDMQYNTFMHVTGGIDIGDYGSTPPERRYRFANNLFWDVNGNTYHDSCFEGNCNWSGQGWIFQGPDNMEDLIIDHNTIAGNVGSLPVLLWLFNGYSEGVQITNNFGYIDGSQGMGQESGDIPNDACSGLHAKALMDCKFTPSYNFSGNVLIGNGVSQSQVQSWYPSPLKNYIPANTSLGSVGWFNCPGPNCSSGTPDFHLKANYCSGCESPAADGGDVGANIDALQDAQGMVKFNGVSNTSGSSATITYVAPDSAACSVDYSSSDPTLVTSFSRVSDNGGKGARNVTLSGLSHATAYNFRINCAVQQPTGEFRTN